MTRADDHPGERSARRTLRVIGAGLVAGLLLAGPARSQGSLWWERPPQGCSLGLSGPTIDRAAAIREARDHAIAGLAAERLGVEITSELWQSGSRFGENTLHTSSGHLRGVHIVGLKKGLDGLVVALACSEGAAAVDSEFARRPCAPGLAGPTLEPKRQRERAKQSGAENLALGLGAEVSSEWQSATGFGMRRVAQVRASTYAESRVAPNSATEITWSWLDGDGDGPLREPGILYVIVCLTEPETTDANPGD